MARNLRFLDYALEKANQLQCQHHTEGVGVNVSVPKHVGCKGLMGIPLIGAPLSVALISHQLAFVSLIMNKHWWYHCMPDFDFDKKRAFIRSITVDILSTPSDLHINETSLSGDWQISTTVGYVGRSSYTKEVDTVLQFKNGEKLSAHIQDSNVMVNFSSRKVEPLPDKFIEVTKSASSTQHYSISKWTVKKPGKVFVVSTVITNDHLDLNNHINYSAYISLAITAVKAANKSHFFSVNLPSQDHLKKMVTFFESEGKLGDHVKMETWEHTEDESPLDEKTFYCSVINSENSKVLSNMAITYKLPQMHCKL